MVSHRIFLPKSNSSAHTRVGWRAQDIGFGLSLRTEQATSQKAIEVKANCRRLLTAEADPKSTSKRFKGL